MLNSMFTFEDALRLREREDLITCCGMKASCQLVDLAMDLHEQDRPADRRHANQCAAAIMTLITARARFTLGVLRGEVDEHALLGGGLRRIGRPRLALVAARSGQTPDNDQPPLPPASGRR
jgi:hypothetical protein